MENPKLDLMRVYASHQQLRNSLDPVATKNFAGHIAKLLDPLLVKRLSTKAERKHCLGKILEELAETDCKSEDFAVCVAEIAWKHILEVRAG